MLKKKISFTFFQFFGAIWSWKEDRYIEQETHHMTKFMKKVEHFSETQQYGLIINLFWELRY